MRLKIRELRVGDSVIPGSFPRLFAVDGMVPPGVTEARVIDGGDGTPFTFRNDYPCTPLHTDVCTFGVDPDWEVEVERP